MCSNFQNSKFECSTVRMLQSLSFLSQQFFWETRPPYFISVPLKLCILALRFANLNEFIPSYQYYRLSLKAGYIFLAHSY